MVELYNSQNHLNARRLHKEERRFVRPFCIIYETLQNLCHYIMLFFISFFCGRVFKVKFHFVARGADSESRPKDDLLKMCMWFSHLLTYVI